jgi:hypothetical protein
MSFCDPKDIDDFFLSLPEQQAYADVRPTVPDTPFIAPPKPPVPGNQMAAIQARTDADKAQAKNGFDKFMIDLRSTYEKSKNVGDGINLASQAIARIGTMGSGGDRSTDTKKAAAMANDYKIMQGAVKDLETLLLQGAINLDWLSPDMYRQIKDIEKNMAPFVDFTNNAFTAVGPFLDLRDPDTGTMSIDKLTAALTGPGLTAAMANIETMIVGAFGEDMSKFARGMANQFQNIQNKIAAAQLFVNSKADYLVGLTNIADSMLTASGELVIGICLMIPGILALVRSAWEWITHIKFNGLNLALNLSFKFDWPSVDLSALWKWPSLDALKRVGANLKNVMGKQQKLWEGAGVACDPQKLGVGWNGVAPDFAELSKKMGEVGTRAALITSGQAKEGIKKLDLESAAKMKVTDTLWNQGGSILPIAPARVNPPAGSPLAAMNGGSTPVGDPTVLNLPNGYTTMNSQNAMAMHPTEGLPVPPDPAGHLSNEIANVADLIAFTRSGMVSAEATRDIGLAIKILAQPKGAATDKDIKKAVKVLLKATRRLRAVKNNQFMSDGGELAPVARDYYACGVKSTKGYKVQSLEDASERLASTANQAPGLNGSLMSIASINNPNAFKTDANSAFDPAKEEAKYQQAITASSAAMAELDKSSSITETLDSLIERLPTEAFPPTYHDAEYRTFLGTLLNASNEEPEKLPLYMACNSFTQKKYLDDLLALQKLLSDIDPKVSDGLYEKAFMQGLLDDNSYTYLSIGKKVLEAFSQKTLEEHLVDFLYHKGEDIRPMLKWLQSSMNQNVTNPPLPLNLTDEENALAALSYEFCNARNRDLSSPFIDLRIACDDVGGPMGYDFIAALALEGMMMDAESRTIEGEDLSEFFTKLKKIAEKMPSGKNVTTMIDIISKGGN